MKKIMMILVVFMMVVPGMIVADEIIAMNADGTVAGDMNVPVAIIPEVVIPTAAEKNLDALVEQYKAKKLEIIELEKDLLRMEGAIMIVNSMVKEEKAKQEVKDGE